MTRAAPKSGRMRAKPAGLDLDRAEAVAIVRTIIEREALLGILSEIAALISTVPQRLEAEVARKMAEHDLEHSHAST